MAEKTEPQQITAAKIQASAMDRQINLSFLLKDFEKIFDMYIYSHSERSEATKMFVMLITVPFVLFSLFGVSVDIELQNKNLLEVIEQFPSFMFLIFSVFGIAGIVPFHRFVAAYNNTYKMIRYMNGYRLLYYQFIKKDIDTFHWRCAIEKDPRLPKPTALRWHWTTGFAIAMFLLNTFYVVLGIWFWDGKSSEALLVALPILMIIIHWLLAKQELQTDDIVRLEKMSPKIDDVLKKIDSEIQ
jgi:hypothetical protein